MTMSVKDESIRALATVTLDASALGELGPQTMDRLADLVAARLAERQAAGDEPFLTATEAARVVDAHPETVRRAIRSGALEVAGYVGQSPRLRRADLDAWIADRNRSGATRVGMRAGLAPRRARANAGADRVLGNALRLVFEEGAS
jgi:excisionase family DNA binding protein